ncbi:hypothetical protein DVH24_014543 [Malus domestica]|uniref:DUF4378 domain-containing protein n=1 Tax=Malus domestica TaxID=3750 RepID=A0A498KKH1_MALDO|nr:hypothetical protein DVH24_014543 [Malus domestica]
MSFTAVKPPSFLPRSLSRRLLQSRLNSPRSSRKQGSQSQVQITVQVKDIIRWTSFSDEKLPPPPPLDYVSSPTHCTASTTITGSTTTCTTCSSNSSSNGSSWCDSDFTSEFLPPWGGNSDPDYQEDSKKYSPCVGRDSMEATSGTGSYAALGPKGKGHGPVTYLTKRILQSVESCPTSVRDKSGLSSCEAKRPHAFHVTQLLSTCRLENPPHVRGRVENYPTLVRDKVCFVLIWSWAISHIANWFYGGTPISSWYQSGLSSCEAKWPHALHVTQLLSTCRLENLPHMQGRVESCPKSMRDKVKLPLCDEEDEQHNPVSVLGFQFGEDEDSSFSSNFDQSLANMERTKEMLMQKIKLFESLVTVDPINLDTSMSFEERTNIEEDDEIAERAMELLNHCKASCSDLKSWELELVEDQLLFDFFREEMCAQRNKKEDGFNREMISKARAWMSGDWGSLEHNKEACVRDMHKGMRWNKFEFEQEELGLEIEIALSEYLVDELLLDLLSR